MHFKFKRYLRNGIDANSKAGCPGSIFGGIAVVLGCRNIVAGFAICDFAMLGEISVMGLTPALKLVILVRFPARPPWFFWGWRTMVTGFAMCDFPILGEFSVRGLTPTRNLVIWVRFPAGSPLLSWVGETTATYLALLCWGFWFDANLQAGGSGSIPGGRLSWVDETVVKGLAICVFFRRFSAIPP